MNYMSVVVVLMAFGAIVVQADVSHILPTGNGKFNWIYQSVSARRGQGQ